MKVLVADDEERYRDYLRASLAEQGHEVSTVDTGRAAIDYGVRFRPDVLITDWMLLNHIHGLRVSNVLRAVEPRLQTIVITGYSSSDLQRDAKHSGVFRYIEKPFTLDEMITAVEGAAAVRYEGPNALFGFLEVDATGRIVHANGKARDMLADAGSEALDVGGIFGDDADRLLRDADGGWVRVSPRARRPCEWILGTKLGPDGGFVVVLPGGSGALCRDPLIRTLLEIDAAPSHRWPVDEHVLVVDGVREVRSLSTLLLEQSGCVSYKADTQELAIRLFRADPKINIVILDYDMPLGDLAGFVAELETLREGVKIVGTSADDRRREFAAVGVERFLDKGWQIEDLIETISA